MNKIIFFLLVFAINTYSQQVIAGVDNNDGTQVMSVLTDIGKIAFTMHGHVVVD